MTKNQKLSFLVWTMAQSLSFLIGGGCDINTDRVELLLVVASSGGWRHVNFDDVRFE